MHPGIVCGFQAERRLANRISPLTACGWRNPGAAESLVSQGADALVSFGLAGALDPALTTSTILIPDHILLPDGQVHHTDAAMAGRLQALFPEALRGAIYAGAEVIATPEDKRTLFARTQALAVDMESAAVAEVATRHGIPFCVFRVVADRAGDTLPAAALNGLKANGSTATGRVLHALLRDPGQLPALVRLGFASRAGLRVLDRSAAKISKALSQLPSS